MIFSLARAWTDLIVRLLKSLLKDRCEPLIENAALAGQIEALHRSSDNPVSLVPCDRFYLSILLGLWPGVARFITIVRPETLIRWHRSAFRIFWRLKCFLWQDRRARLSEETIALVRRMITENPLWGAERIRGELLKIGVKLTKRTIQKLMRMFRPRPRGEDTQTWRTFLKNHAGEIWACDFFSVVTITFRPLYVFLIIAHQTREIVGWGITSRPTSAWSLNELRRAVVEHGKPSYLIHDRGTQFGPRFREEIKHEIGILSRRTPFRTPKANAIAERTVGTIRRECLDQVIVFGEEHLRRILDEYIDYYNTCRPHQGRSQQIPKPVEDKSRGSVPVRINSRPILNGLHHHYFYEAA